MLMDLKFLNQTMVVLIGSIYQHQHWITINPLIFNFKEEVTEEYILAQGIKYITGTISCPIGKYTIMDCLL